MQHKNTVEEGKNLSGLKTINGLTAYDILRMPDCPYELPSARSNTQAKIDYERLEPRVFEWYNSNSTTK